MPEISVLMANYNTPIKYLKEAIDSVLNQTFTDFEFIIVDDCSTDSSLDFIEGIKDSRIVLLKNNVNLGLTKSLNKGLQVAKGKYIVRMDSDDICLPNRIEVQVEYMRRNPNVIVAGSWVHRFGIDDSEYKPVIRSTEEYKICLLFRNSPTIVHPSAILDREKLSRFHIKYDERYSNSQDYKMWIDCSKYGDVRIIPEILLNYRTHDKQISTKGINRQSMYAKQIVVEELTRLDMHPSDEELEIHQMALSDRILEKRTVLWLNKILENNKKYGIYNHRMLEKILSQRCVNSLLKAADDERSSLYENAKGLISYSDRFLLLIRLLNRKLLHK